jgi:hypothetical protein
MVTVSAIIGSSTRPAALVMIRARAWTSSARCPGSSRSSGVAGCGGVKKFRDSCTGALRAERLLVVGARTGRASQQTVDDGTQPDQVGDRPERVGMARQANRAIPRTRRIFPIAEISPIGWDQDRIGVRRCKQKVRTTVFTSAAKNNQDVPIQRMAGAADRYFLWQGMVVGSLSRDPSIGSITTA